MARLHQPRGDAQPPRRVGQRRASCACTRSTAAGASGTCSPTTAAATPSRSPSATPTAGPTDGRTGLGVPGRLGGRPRLGRTGVAPDPQHLRRGRARRGRRRGPRPWVAAWDSAYDARMAARDFVPGTDWESERRWQAGVLHDLFGNPFRPFSLDPSWLLANDGAAAHLARLIYDEDRFGDLPYLADALEDARLHLRGGPRPLPGRGGRTTAAAGSWTPCWGSRDAACGSDAGARADPAASTPATAQHDPQPRQRLRSRSGRALSCGGRGRAGWAPWRRTSSLRRGASARSSSDSQSARRSRSMPGLDSLTRQEQGPHRKLAQRSTFAAVNCLPWMPTRTRPRPKTGKTIGPFTASSPSALPSSERTRNASLRVVAVDAQDAEPQLQRQRREQREGRVGFGEDDILLEPGQLALEEGRLLRLRRARGRPRPPRRPCRAGGPARAARGCRGSSGGVVVERADERGRLAGLVRVVHDDARQRLPLARLLPELAARRPACRRPRRRRRTRTFAFGLSGESRRTRAACSAVSGPRWKTLDLERRRGPVLQRVAEDGRRASVGDARRTQSSARRIGRRGMAYGSSGTAFQYTRGGCRRISALRRGEVLGEASPQAHRLPPIGFALPSRSSQSARPPRARRKSSSRPIPPRFAILA